MGTARARIHRRQLVAGGSEIRATIARDPERYRRDFGVVPTFRGGLHGGPVTAGELGDLMRQIVFVGDILNTAARLEEYAKRTGFVLVVSGAVLAQLALPPGIEATPCGELALPGKEASVAAYGLTGSLGFARTLTNAESQNEGPEPEPDRAKDPGAGEGHE